MDLTTPAAHTSMRETHRRLDPSRWSGALFVALAVPALALGTKTSPYLDEADDYVAAYADGAGAAPFGRVLGLAAVIALLWALARLRLAFPPDRHGLPGAVLPLAGVVFASAWIGSIAVTAATYTAVDHSDDFGGFEVVPETAFVVDLIADGFTWALLAGAAVLVWGTALAARRAGVLPGWMTWIGMILVPLLPVAWILFMLPALIFMLWFAVVVAIVPTASRAGA